MDRRASRRSPILSCSLRFNASNSGDLAAYAFTNGCEIGVDIEQHRALRDFENIARRFFSPEETAELLELSAAEKTAGFFNCWTRKEAYIKALGGGLSIPLDSFRVTLGPGLRRGWYRSMEARRGGRWTLHDFTPAPDYAGAIAYRWPAALHPNKRPGIGGWSARSSQNVQQPLRSVTQ